MKKYNVNVNGTAYEVTVEEVVGGVAPAPVAAEASAQAGLSSKIPLWLETSPFREERDVDKTAEPVKSFSVTSPFREGRSARPLSVGCGVSRRTGRLWIETWGSLICTGEH